MMPGLVGLVGLSRHVPAVVGGGGTSYVVAVPPTTTNTRQKRGWWDTRTMTAIQHLFGPNERTLTNG